MVFGLLIRSQGVDSKMLSEGTWVMGGIESPSFSAKSACKLFPCDHSFL